MKFSSRSIIFYSLGIIVFIILASLMGVYYNAPIEKLFSQYTYTPINSKKQRVAGLKTPSFVPLDQISPFLKKVVLIREDAKFRIHSGFDFTQIQKAIHEAVTSDRRLRGASTISQQLVKNFFFDNQRTLTRKLLEAIYTLKLEREMTKSEIFSLYLNNIPWGANIFGIKQAARFYFGTTPDKLTLAQSSFLAVIIPNPYRYSRSYLKGDLSEFIQDEMIKLVALYLRVYATELHPIPFLVELEEFIGSKIDDDLSNSLIDQYIENQS